ncbi:hypothetical protein [Myroides indicus]|nr:hypothetical protein [Myroides indicus]
MKLEILQYLENKLEKNPLFMQLVRQLEKDFQLSVASDLIFNAQTAEELVVETQFFLEKVAVNTPAKFSSLLYRIDVAEADINNLQAGNLAEYLEQVTFLVLKREFQKVYIRNTL